MTQEISSQGTKKSKGLKRRAFLGGSAAIIGGGLFAVHWRHDAAIKAGEALTAKEGAGSFNGWLKIGTDDTITLYVPTVDMGQGSHTAMAQMLAEELDADLAKIKVETAPAEYAFANAFVLEGAIASAVALPDILVGTTKAAASMAARRMDFQQSSGSNAISHTGHFGMRVIGAAARESLIAVAAKRLKVPSAQLTSLSGRVIHANTGRSLSYGELAIEAAERPLSTKPTLKNAKDFRVIGQSVARDDVPSKVDGSAIYGIDFELPLMRIATVMAAPVRGGILQSVDSAPAMAIKGVEKVIRLENAVVVVANGYWQASQGLAALSPKFSDGGHSKLTSEAIYQTQAGLVANGKPSGSQKSGDVNKALSATGVKRLEANYRVPFLHQATMEPFAITAHFKDGVLNIWGGVQAPLEFKAKAAEVSALPQDKVIFNPMILGGGFGRRFRSSSQHIVQVVQIAMQVPFPVKLIWSREEDVSQGGYRPQVSAKLQGGVTPSGRIAGWSIDYADTWPATSAITDLTPYSAPDSLQNYYEYISNQQPAVWRSVDYSQHGFYFESFFDELAHLAGTDPFVFRRDHLPVGSRERRVLEEVAKRAGWGTALPAGIGRGIALCKLRETIVALIIEASMKEEGKPIVHRAVSVTDCGQVVNPRNAQAQIEGGILMGLSAAMTEQITLEGGAVVEKNFGDYPILQLAMTPKMETHFLASDAPIGGVGEMGVPPAAPALANAIFAATGKRYRRLPFTLGDT